GDAQPRPLEAARLDQHRHDAAHDVRGDGKADAAVGRLARGADLRVHADHLSAQVEQRPAGVAGVDRRVRLDDLRDAVAAHDAAGRDAAPRGADDPGAHAAAQAEGVADGDHPLAGPYVIRVAQRDRVRAVWQAIDAKYRQVAVRVGADHLGRDLQA